MAASNAINTSSDDHSSSGVSATKSPEKPSPAPPAQPPRKSLDGHVTYLSTADAPAERDGPQREKTAVHILTEEECYDELAFGWPGWKKWWVLTVIFLVQCSMNLNTSLYSNGIASRPHTASQHGHKGMTEEFGISAQAARCGAMVFLVTYAFGCELWAPWSEEFGRKPVLQISLFLVNVWQLPVALAKNFGTVMAGRALGGLCSAGGSVTLGLVADMYEPEDHQFAINFVVLSSVGGSIIGPIVGGFCEQWLAWRWTIWLQLIAGGVVQLLHLLTVPESRTTTMLTAIAKKRRKQGEDVWGPDEVLPWRERFSAKEVITIWTRPFVMYLTEPIVLALSLLSGFSDALIFMFIQSFSLVYSQYNFKPFELGLAFLPLGVGYLLAFVSFIFSIRRNIRRRAQYPNDERVQFEERLWWLLYLAPLLPIGLITFAWTSGGPPVHWIGSMICSCLVGIANYAVYAATIDYMVTAYGPYSASATGGNGWSRDFLAGVLTVPATPFFSNIGPNKHGQKHYHHLQHASTILFCISTVLVAAVFVIYWKGPTLRKRSPFAQQLSDERAEVAAHRTTSMDVEKAPHPDAAAASASSPATAARPPLGPRHSTAREWQDERVRPGLASRRSSYLAAGGTPGALSRRNSHTGSRASGSRANSIDEATAPANMAERLQARLRPDLGSRRNTHSSALGDVAENTGQEEA